MGMAAGPSLSVTIARRMPSAMSSASSSSANRRSMLRTHPFDDVGTHPEAVAGPDRRAHLGEPGAQRGVGQQSFHCVREFEVGEGVGVQPHADPSSSMRWAFSY